MIKPKLSVVLATRNEESNLGDCLKSIQEIADEIIIVDEKSTDKTIEIAHQYNAKVYTVVHEPIFHKTKQKALDMATGDWILQLDADERVTPGLAVEIKKILTLNDQEIRQRPKVDSNKDKLFQRHQQLINKRAGGLGRKTGEIVAFFIPRVNYFLGRPLYHAGGYPDGVIRLIKKGKAHFPAKSVHELMTIDGEVAWLTSNLEHYDSPNFERYLARANRYTDLTADEYRQNQLPKNIITLLKYGVVIPKLTFLKLYIRHKGFMDGFQGFVWSLFSALHYPIAYFKYWSNTDQTKK